MDPVLDARWLAMFMICCTQDGWAAQQLPSNAPPDYTKTPATQMGLAQDIQEQFYKAFGQGFNEKLTAHYDTQPLTKGVAMPKAATGEDLTPLDVFELAGNLLRVAGGPAYKPPACPNSATIRSAVTALNQSAKDNQG